MPTGFPQDENRTKINPISGFIDPYGRILQQSEIFIEETLVQDIPLRNRTTFYTRYGDVFVRLCFILSIVGIGYGFFRRKQQYIKGKR